MAHVFASRTFCADITTQENNLSNLWELMANVIGPLDGIRFQKSFVQTTNVCCIPSEGQRHL